MASRHLLNPLARADEPTPSSLDGVGSELERDLRALGALLIQQAGIMLKVPQVVMATAQVLFQRFWFVTSLKHFGVRDIGMGALFLASKLEESPIRMRDLINCYAYLVALIQHCSLANVSQSSNAAASFRSYVPMDYFATEFYDMKDAVVIAEMQILKRLGFQTQTGLPYGHLVNYLQVLELTDDSELVHRCWACVNDMLQTTAPALFPQSTLAVAAIYLAARMSSHPLALPLEPVPWWTLFDAHEADVLQICASLLSLYRDWGADRAWSPTEQASSSVSILVWKRAADLPLDKQVVRDRIVAFEPQAGDKSQAIEGNS
ncbi:hypothetical protein OIV83_005136 [Microbotryomycetes sp. JL201]|nr:hypothetical protein OIV83_005136 [Microbotryomycetes sp. JL201]